MLPLFIVHLQLFLEFLPHELNQYMWYASKQVNIIQKQEEDQIPKEICVA